MASSVDRAPVESTSLDPDVSRRTRLSPFSKGDEPAQRGIPIAIATRSFDMAVSDTNQGDFDSHSSSAPEARSVLRAAMQIEADPAETARWYLHTQIAELDNLTPAQLVLVGRFEDVLRFLSSIRDGKRD
jgi:hypothetical protein